jgi:phospholipid N-methyltransferase
MTEEISPLHSPFLQLGAGTGVFTKTLLSGGVPEHALTLVEYGSDFMRLLQFRLRQARVLWMDASQLASHNLFHEQSVGAVVSGLPLLSMSSRKVISILSGAFHYIRADGAFYQFTYGPRRPVLRPILDRLGLKAKRIGGTVRNLPPTAVYRITRRPPHRSLAGVFPIPSMTKQIFLGRLLLHRVNSPMLCDRCRRPGGCSRHPSSRIAFLREVLDCGVSQRITRVATI